MTEPARTKGGWPLALAMTLWAALVSVGFVSLAAYSGSPGALRAPPTRWPASAGLERPRGRWAVLVFPHPRSPCSRASLSELSRAAARFREPAEVVAVFTVPEGQDQSWAAGALWDSAGRLSGRRLVDPGGRLARIFRADTSGFIALYDRGGVLRYHGGLTASRGHEGSDVGGQSLTRWLGGERGAERAPVYGCALREDPNTEVPTPGGHPCPR